MTNFEARIRHSNWSSLYYVSIYQDGRQVQRDAWYGFSFWFARLAARRILRRYRKDKFVVR